MRLNDEVIAHVAKLVQLAILTGTDVVDHMRMMVLNEEDGSLFLEENYSQASEENIRRMIEEIEGHMQEES
tara:strand:- start:209 stop:421 length:213 start_codon:yes stop_codon:yes gene_type:complete